IFFSTNRRVGSVTRRENQNLIFYKNQMKSKPDGDTIENILSVWKGNYRLLEKNHNYIQWLFPNRRPGINPHAATLTDKEAQIIRETPELRNRVKRAFEMMLDFYGMELDGTNFKLTWNCKERLQELNKWGNHNFLRISRILLALKELGSFHFPLLSFLSSNFYSLHFLSVAFSQYSLSCGNKKSS
ncbi:Opioid growth factor receptor-like protein 1,Opioid growth factor receptor, partial [Acanthosepion pharaonis]